MKGPKSNWACSDIDWTMVDLDNIKTTFAFFDDWEDKYRFLIDLGKSVPVLFSEFRIAENLVGGGQSQVWLLGEYDGNSTG
ncbi:MAG: hypothetical protein CM1200mP9_03920 [Gammaproteobacteria bacterium]|nr:MAG: hypothetical protein CM1200mP9_03920 [Gammaproteobacteria bacterium]